MVNFFYLDHNPRKTAQYYCDKHLIKIAVEINQMLCNFHHEIGTENPPFKNCRAVISTLGPYRWIQENEANFKYAVKLSEELIKEYKYRFNKKGESTKLDSTIEWNLKHIPKKHLPNSTRKSKFIPTNSYLKFDLVSTNTILNNRLQYTFLKCVNDSWRKRGKPIWFDTLLNFQRDKTPQQKNQLQIWVNKKLPKIAREKRFPIFNNHCFLRVIYDTLFEGKWQTQVKTHQPNYNQSKSLIHQLTISQLYASVQIARFIGESRENCVTLNNNSLIFRRAAPKSEFSQNIYEKIKYPKMLTSKRARDLLKSSAKK
tara:strand:+ start:5133 stop:6074 length:942 start_codon:yes stop_codon:yes gene_type:complete